MATKEIVKLVSFKEPVVDTHMKRFGIFDDSLNLGEKVQIITRFVERTVKKDKLVVCDPGCGGVFSGEWRECPYCGAIDDSVPENKIAVLTADIVLEDEIRLDEALDELEDIRKRSAATQWEFCCKVKSIYEEMRGNRRLFECRKLPNSKKYSWSEFCQKELHISPNTSYFYMDIARYYNKDKFEEIGVSKLSVILRLPPDEQAAMMSASKGKSYRELRDEVRKRLPGGTARVTEGRQFDRSNLSKSAMGAHFEKKVAKDKNVSVIYEKASTTIKLFAKASGKQIVNKVNNDDAFKPAKKLADQPWAIEISENGVEIHYRVFAGQDGGWVLKREFQSVPTPK